MYTIVKRITSGLLGLSIAGMVIIGCEKSNGPDPYPCNHTYNQLVLLSKADQGPLTPAIPLDSLDRLIINDAAIGAIVNVLTKDTLTGKDTLIQAMIPLDITTVGKIIFQ